MNNILRALVIIIALSIVGCGGSQNKSAAPQNTQQPKVTDNVATSTKVNQGVWTSYANTTGKSNIVAYRIGSDYIDVQFRSGKNTIYRYSYKSAGIEKVEEMKRLARKGSGLNGYINRNARKLYEYKQ